MSLPSRTHAAEALLTDERPAVRLRALDLLAGMPGERSDALLLAALADPVAEVSAAAARALAERYPLLVLRPLPVREPSRSARQSAMGRQWESIRGAAARLVADGSHRDVRPETWARLPGLLPDVLEELFAQGQSADAEELLRRTDPHGIERAAHRQLIVAPTYRCNRSCSYCYAKGWERRFPPDLSREDLIELFEYCREREIDSILLAGGEPTVYAHFVELLRHARERGIAVHLTTNGLYGPEVRAAIERHGMRQIVAHAHRVGAPEEAVAERLFRENIGAAVGAGVSALFRFTMTEATEESDWRAVLDLATELGVEGVNFAFAFESCDGTNEFVRHREDRLAAIGAKIDAFTRDAAASGVGAALCKPIPLCALSEPALRRLLLAGVIRQSCAAPTRHFTGNLTVNPDLGTFPCNALAFPGPRLSRDTSLEEYGRHHGEAIRDLLRRPLFEACRSCILWYRGFCQGVCLAELAADAKPREGGSRRGPG